MIFLKKQQTLEIFQSIPIMKEQLIAENTQSMRNIVLYFRKNP